MKKPESRQHILMSLVSPKTESNIIKTVSCGPIPVARGIGKLCRPATLTFMGWNNGKLDILSANIKVGSVKAEPFFAVGFKHGKFSLV